MLARSAARPGNQQFTEEAVRTEGSDANLVIASSSAMASEVTRQLGLRVQALFLDGARGLDLDRLVLDRTNGEVVRKGATSAVVTLQLSRSAGALPAVSLLAGTRMRARGSEIEFALTAPASLAAGSTGPVSAIAEAVTAGQRGNVAANTITEFAQQPSDPELRVTNPDVAAGGDERETDARYAARARMFYRSARRGILSAIEFGALTTPGVRQATAIEEVDQFGDPTGRVSLFIADAQGNGNSALVDAVLVRLREYRAAGIIVDVSGSTPQYVAIRYRLRFAAGIDTTLASQQVAATTIARVNGLAPTAVLPVSLLFAAARSVPGVIVLGDAIVEPVGDLTPAPGAVIRTRLDLVSFE